VRTGPGSNGAAVVGGGPAGLAPPAVLATGEPEATGSGDPDDVAGGSSGSDVTGTDDDDIGGLDDAGLGGDDEAVGEEDPDADVGEPVGVGSAVVEPPTTT
jgi:hypothetical protein